MDGVFSPHVQHTNHNDQAESRRSLVREYDAAPTAANKQGQDPFLAEKNTRDFIDRVIEKLPQQVGINPGRPYALCRSLAKESPDRGPVKFGMSIFGLCREAGDRELFQTLGRHASIQDNLGWGTGLRWGGTRSGIRDCSATAPEGWQSRVAKAESYGAIRAASGRVDYVPNGNRNSRNVLRSAHASGTMGSSCERRRTMAPGKVR